QMVADLEEIRLRRVDMREGKIESGRSHEEYRRAFADYGIDVEQPAAVAQVQDSPIRAALVAALDDWAFQVPARPVRTRLLEIARGVEREPDGWASRVREALAKGDRARLGELAAAGVSGVRPALLALAGSMLTQMGEPDAAETLLRPAQRC